MKRYQPDSTNDCGGEITLAYVGIASAPGRIGSTYVCLECKKKIEVFVVESTPPTPDFNELMRKK
jgi:hypothetical protein